MQSNIIASDVPLTRPPFALPPEAMAPPARGVWACIWDHGTTPPTPLHCQLPGRVRGARAGGSPMYQLGQRGLDCSTKAVSREVARALGIVPASNMRGTVSRKVGEHTGAHPNLTLLHSLLRTRRVCGMPDRLERYCLGACARAASRTSALSDCCATAVALQTWAPQRASGSRGPSRQWPIGKLRPGRCRLATQI